jgi:alkyl hydroperoxide reductase subunit F
MFDVIIIGGGPAGVASAVYSARKKIKTLLLTKSFGGQSIVSDDIGNWIGDISISGVSLAEKFEKHVKSFDDIEIKEGVEVVDVREVSNGEYPVFEIETKDGEIFKSKSVLIATGGKRRKLNIPGEKEFNGKGVVYCSTCDAPLFDGKKVVVVGGGNAGVEAVVDLLPYADEIFLFEKTDSLKADKSTQEKIKSEDKVNIIYNADVLEIKGDVMVEKIIYKENEEEKEMEVGGVFVEIGSVANSDMVKNVVELDEYNQIKVDCNYGTTSKKGIFAAGDVTDGVYKQNNISAGDGVKAILSVYDYLNSL